MEEGKLYRFKINRAALEKASSMTRVLYRILDGVHESCVFMYIGYSDDYTKLIMYNMNNKTKEDFITREYNVYYTFEEI